MAEIRGQIISGKYRLLSVLGEGAMRVVYRAEQLDAEGRPLREVALKMVQPPFFRDPNFARRFLREVRVTARLRSPHTGDRARHRPDRAGTVLLRHGAKSTWEVIH